MMNFLLALSQVQINKCVFTNNCKEHVMHVWDRLFPAERPNIKVYSIEDTYENGWFHPKQSPMDLLRFVKQRMYHQRKLV